MKKFFISFFIAIAVASLGFNAIAIAQGQAPAPQSAPTASSVLAPIQQLDQTLQRSGLSNFAGRYHRLSSTEAGADIITSLIFTIIDFLKYLVGGVAVLYLIVIGIRLIAAGKKIDEVSEKQKESLKYIIYGLVLIITADELVKRVFFGEYGECLASASNAQECATTGSSLVTGLYSLILALLASIAIMVLVISAFRMITAYGNEETVTKEKKRIMMSIVGLLVAGVGEFVVKRIIFQQGGTRQIDVAALQGLLFNFINFVAAFIGVGAFVVLLYGGYMYVVSFGNEEQTGKAKKIIIGAFVGIAIALAAFGIVTTIVSFTSGRPAASTIGLPAGLGS